LYKDKNYDMGRKVYAIGESLIDIIFSNGDVQAARPGGSMLNSVVSLGRTKTDVVFLSEFGDDRAGGFIADFLEKNNVRTGLIYRYQDGKTPLALAFLDQNGNASYEFYKPYPIERLQLQMPGFEKDDVLLFGSFFGIDPSIRTKLTDILNLAREQEMLIVYDPNFRKPHAHELPTLKPYILENIRYSSLVKASNEDLEIIFGTCNPDELRRIDELKEKVMIITHGAEGTQLETPDFSGFYPARKIEVKSTIGAGDNFNAGLIYGLLAHKITHQTIAGITEHQWQNIISYAINFAAETCMSYDNYISHEFAASLNK
jgi:fructokinase